MSKALVTFSVTLYKPTGVTIKQLKSFVETGMILSKNTCDVGLPLRSVTVERIAILRTETDYTRK